MGLFDGFRVNQAISAIVAAPRGSAAAVNAAALIREIGTAAVPKLLQALVRDKNGSVPELLAEVLSNATLPIIVKDGLLNEDVDVSTASRLALALAPQLDPNRLLELYLTRGGSAVEISQLLINRKDTLTAKSVLRLLELAKTDRDAGLFKLIDKVATPAMVPALIGFLKNAEWGALVHIAGTIQRFPSAAVRDALLRLLEHGHRLVREAALDALANLNMHVPPGPICALLRDPDLSVQTKAIETAVALNDPSCIHHLLHILQDESEHSRRAAVEVLNAVGDANAVTDLLLALKDSGWWVRVRAADALGTIGGPKVIDAALALLRNEDEFIRRTAMEILNVTKDERAFDHLVLALHDPDWWVRERSIDALANLGDKRAAPHLANLLANEDEGTTVVIRALAQLADPRAVESILAKLSSADERVQRQAAGALGALTNADQLETVLRGLRGFVPLSDVVRDSAQTVVQELAARLKRPGAVASLASVTAGDELLQTMMVSGRAAPAEYLALDDVLESTIPLVAQGSVAKPVRSTAVSSEQPKRVHAASERIELSSIKPGSELGGRYTVVGEIGRGASGLCFRYATE